MKKMIVLTSLWSFLFIFSFSMFGCSEDDDECVVCTLPVNDISGHQNDCCRIYQNQIVPNHTGSKVYERMGCPVRGRCHKPGKEHDGKHRRYANPNYGVPSYFIKFRFYNACHFSHLNFRVCYKF